jgi:hypothetical protein
MRSAAARLLIPFQVFRTMSRRQGAAGGFCPIQRQEVIPRNCLSKLFWVRPSQ